MKVIYESLSAPASSSRNSYRQ